MRATIFTSGPDKTFAIALAIVALVGALEIAAVAIHYLGQRRAVAPAAPPSAATVEPATPRVAPAAATSPSPAPALTQGSTAAQSTPSNAALSAAEHLLKEATSLRERGDTTNALARLQEAAQRDPKNANVLAEMAMIYESVQALDRSNETWRRIQEIGPGAGALYELAELKLKVGVAPVAGGPGFAGVSPLAGNTRTGPDGIPDGATFGITEASVTETPDAEAQTNLTLRVGVKVRPKTLVDHTKVKIQVYFYDTVNNSKVALTDAEVNYEWLTPNHDWKSSNPEILAVSYVRLKNGAISSEAALTEAAAAVTPPSSGRKSRSASKAPTAPDANRKYAGYQVRVYYNDQLQDVRAEPTKLLNDFPPPLTLGSQ
ncbi:MAG: tetratricopeptide repeat protein [Chthoniobacterales bacterium]|nr:tetratricopeptide repeat protein [Chthoniobacterales bacterium]